MRQARTRAAGADAGGGRCWDANARRIAGSYADYSTFDLDLIPRRRPCHPYHGFDSLHKSACADADISPVQHSLPHPLLPLLLIPYSPLRPRDTCAAAVRQSAMT